jgi:SNF2 family DNA or RNA helicase
LKFLHFEPFSRTAVFQRHILQPLSKDTLDRAVNLRALLHAICLRRKEKYLNLPEPFYKEISIELKDEERIAYSSILKKCEREIDELVSTQAKSRKKYNILFAAMMRLRRLCNHGTLSISAQIPLSPTLTSDAEDESLCNFCGSNDEDVLALLSMSEFCKECGRNLSKRSLASKSKSLDSESGSSTPSCAGYPKIYRPSPQSFLIPGNSFPGSSTKLLAVVENLMKSPSGSKRYERLSYVRRGSTQ